MSLLRTRSLRARASTSFVRHRFLAREASARSGYTLRSFLLAYVVNCEAYIRFSRKLLERCAWRWMNVPTKRATHWRLDLRKSPSHQVTKSPGSKSQVSRPPTRLMPHVHRRGFSPSSSPSTASRAVRRDHRPFVCILAYEHAAMLLRMFTMLTATARAFHA
jgi:hypothetical protein